jgi:hypothetical protein
MTVRRDDSSSGTRELQLATPPWDLPEGPSELSWLWLYAIGGLVAGATIFAAGALFAKWLPSGCLG